MAKCISYPNGVIERVTDIQAAIIVAAEAGTYTTKNKWRSFLGTDGRKKYQEAMAANFYALGPVIKTKKPKKQGMTKQQRHSGKLKFY